jgi:hypothetical protein
MREIMLQVVTKLKEEVADLINRCHHDNSADSIRSGLAAATEYLSPVAVGPKQSRIIARLWHQMGGVDLLETLQYHADETVYSSALSLLDSHWGDMVDDLVPLEVAASAPALAVYSHPQLVAPVGSTAASSPVLAQPRQDMPTSAARASVMKRPGSHMKRIRPMQHDGRRSFNNAAKASRVAVDGSATADAKKAKLQLAPLPGANTVL